MGVEEDHARDPTDHDPCQRTPGELRERRVDACKCGQLSVVPLGSTSAEHPHDHGAGEKDGRGHVVEVIVEDDEDVHYS